MSGIRLPSPATCSIDPYEVRMHAVVLLRLEEDANPTDVTAAVANTPGVESSVIHISRSVKDLERDGKKSLEKLVHGAPVEEAQPEREDGRPLAQPPRQDPVEVERPGGGGKLRAVGSDEEGSG